MDRTVSYRREMNHNYLMLEAESGQENSYVTKMLMENSIDGLLKFRVKKIDGCCYFCYEITSRQPLGRLLESHSINEKELRQMVVELARTLVSVEEYMLLEHQILLEPEFIYIEPQTFQLGLCMVPGEQGDFPEKLSRLLEYLLGKVDYQDHPAVVLAYGLYRESLKENYGMEDLQEFLASRECRNGKRGQVLGEDLQTLEEDLAESLTKQPRSEPSEILSPEREPVIHTTGQKPETASLGPGKELRYWKQVAGAVCLLAATPVFVWWLMGLEFFVRYGVMIELGEAGLTAAYFLWKHSDSEEKFRKGNTRQMGKREKEEQTGEIPPWEMVFYEEEELKQEADSIGSVVPSTPRVERVVVEPQTILLTEADRPLAKRVLSSQDPAQPDIPVPYYPFLIGKQTGLADCVLERETVSRLHVRIDETEEGYKLTDLNSTNGTRVDGRLLEANETTVLEIGMEVQIADLRFRFM